MNHGQKLQSIRQTLISQIIHGWAGRVIGFPRKQVIHPGTSFVLVAKLVQQWGELRNHCLIRGMVFQGISVSCAHWIMECNRKEVPLPSPNAS